MKKGFMIIGGIIAIVASISVGSYYFMKWRVIHQREAISVEAENFDLDSYLVKNGEEIRIPEIDTDDWKTYISEEYGFSFKYPKSWEVMEIYEKKMPEYDFFQEPETEKFGRLNNMQSLLLCVHPKNEEAIQGGSCGRNIEINERYYNWTGMTEWEYVVKELKKVEVENSTENGEKEEKEVYMHIGENNILGNIDMFGNIGYLGPVYIKSKDKVVDMYSPHYIEDEWKRPFFYGIISTFKILN